MLSPVRHGFDHRLFRLPIAAGSWSMPHQRVQSKIEPHKDRAYFRRKLLVANQTVKIQIDYLIWMCDEYDSTFEYNIILYQPNSIIPNTNAPVDGQISRIMRPSWGCQACPQCPAMNQSMIYPNALMVLFVMEFQLILAQEMPLMTNRQRCHRLWFVNLLQIDDMWRG